jgi:NAD-reducing hydrogenase large subunit
MKRITIEPVSRIEGHAKITIHLDDDGHVANTEFHVTQVRGFEKFTEGQPFYEMPGITARICGICPVSHLLASAKAGTPSWQCAFHPLQENCGSWFTWPRSCNLTL